MHLGRKAAVGEGIILLLIAAASVCANEPAHENITQRDIVDYARQLVTSPPPGELNLHYGSERIVLGISFMEDAGDDAWKGFAAKLSAVLQRYHPDALKNRFDRVAAGTQGRDDVHAELVGVTWAICKACTATSPRKDPTVELHPDAKRDLLLAIAAECPSAFGRYLASSEVLSRIFPDPEGWDRYHIVVPPGTAGSAMNTGLLRTVREAPDMPSLELLATLTQILGCKGLAGR